MAFLFFVFVVIFLSRKGTSACTLADLDVPVVPFCDNHERSGKIIVIASHNVPTNQIVDCECEVRVAGTQKLIANYESPDYLNCGVELQIGDKLYSCADSYTYIDVEEKFNMVYRKTTSRKNPNMCMMLQAEPAPSSITVYCKKGEEQKVTMESTTQEAITTVTTAPTPGTSISSSNTNIPLTSTKTDFPSSVSNATSLHSSTTQMTKSNVAITSKSLTSTSSFSSSTSSVSSDLTTVIPDHSTTIKDTTFTSDLTTVMPDNSTSFKDTKTTLTTIMSIPVRHSTTEDHITSERYNYPSPISETTQKESNTSITTSFDTSVKSSTAGHTSTTTRTTFTTDNATFANIRRSKEDTQWKRVVIICSVTGCVLLLVIAVALSILIYRHRATRTKKTLTTVNHQSYIDAFDSEDGSGKSGGVSLNTLLPTDHINEPSNRLYSIPYSSQHYTTRTNEDTGRAPATKDVELHQHRDAEVERQKYITQCSSRVSGIDMTYDHTANTFDKGSVEPSADYDHVNDYPQDHQDTAPPDLSGWVGNDETGESYTTGSKFPQDDNYVARSRQHQATTNLGQGYSEIYAIVRKPRETHLQQKRTKLVSFKGDETGEEEENDTKQKGILKNKNSDMHLRLDSRLHEKQSNLLNTTRIPRTQSDNEYPYRTVSQMNRSDEEKVLQNH